MSEKMELAEAGLRHADGLTAQLDRPHWAPSRAHIEQARNSIKKLAEMILASSPAQEPVTTEPVAWTNEAQLGFLKEPGYRVVPMAMWAFQHSAHPIALYTIPAPPQPGPEEIAEHLYTKFCADPSIEWQDAPEKLKDVWRRYAVEIVALPGEEGK